MVKQYTDSARIVGFSQKRVFIIVASSLLLLFLLSALISCNDDILNTPATVEDPNDLQPLTEEGAELAFQLFTITPVTDAQAYKLEIASDILFTDILFSRIDYPGPGLAGAAALEADTTYYWRASVRKDGTWGYPTEGRSFRMANLFEGLSPADGGGTSDTTPLLSWDGVTDADGYELQLAENEEELPGSDLIVCSINRYQMTETLSKGDSRFWRFRAKNRDGARTGWSSILSFSLFEIPTDGLVIEYLFDGNNNNDDIAYDTSGNARHGTIYGAVPSEDRFGNAASAYSFDGTSSDYIQSPSVSITWESGFGLSAWVHKTGDADYRANSTVVTQSAGSTGGHAFRLYVNDYDDTPGAWAYYSSSGYEYVESYTEISGWTHLSLSLGDGYMKMYQNGILIDSVSFTAELLSVDRPFLFGRWIDSTYNWQGILDDLRIYNRPLAEVEIEALYREGGWEPGLDRSFLKFIDNPVLEAGPSGSWDSNGVYGSTILYEDGEYKMWYGGYDGNKVRVGYATSSDGREWNKYSNNPVLGNGMTGSFDSVQAGYPSVVKIDGMYHMWYTGRSSSWAIGHATSLDGINWTKDTANPVLSGGAIGSFDSNYAYLGSVFHEGNQFVMYFDGYDGSTYRIGRAVSVDGTIWVKDDAVVLSPGASGSWDDRHVQGKTILHFNDSYHMWYSGFDGSNWQGIGLATSSDGINWTKSVRNPVLSRGPASYDATHVFQPAVINVGEHYLMYYDAYSGSRWSIALAELLK